MFGFIISLFVKIHEIKREIVAIRQDIECFKGIEPSQCDLTDAYE